MPGSLNNDLSFTYTIATQNGIIDGSLIKRSARQPIIPDLGFPLGSPFVFDTVLGDGDWFDPPLANGYEYQTDGNSNFTEVGLPPLATVSDGDGLYLVSSTYGDQPVSAGSTYMFPSPVDFFTVTGIDPAIDGGDPLAFPTFMVFDQATVSFTMTPIPEPSTFSLIWLVISSLLGWHFVHRRRTSQPTG